MLIAEKGLSLPTEYVDLAGGEHLTEAFGRINPHRTVPVLKLEDGTCLLDSTSISMYLDEVFPKNNLTGHSAKERALVAMWQREMDLNGLMAVAECFRNTSRGLTDRALTGPVNYPQIPELGERGRRRVRRFFSDLNARLGDSTYVAIERFTIADITAYVSVEFARAIKEQPSSELVHLARWRDAVAGRSCVNG
jgi:glutathione S-transferase